MLAAVVIGAIIGVALIGYNIYQIFANPDLTPYERGKLVGKSIGELIFLLPAGIFKAPRLIKLLSKAGRLFKTSKVSGILSKVGVLLRATSSKLAPLNIFNKTSKIRGAIRLLSNVRKPSDLQLIRQFKSFDKATEYLQYFGSFDTAVQFANKVGDAEQALVILRRAGNYEKVLRYSSKITNMNELAYLIELPDDLLDALKVEDVSKVVAALKQWNINGAGANQGIEHIILYARGKPVAGKEARLTHLHEITGSGPFSHKNPKDIIEITTKLMNYTQTQRGTSLHRSITTQKEVFLIEKPNSSDGIIIYMYNGKLSTFYRIKTKKFATAK